MFSPKQSQAFNKSPGKSPVPSSRMLLRDESPQTFQPMKIADPSMKKLKLYEVMPLHGGKFNSYYQRQKSINHRDIAHERVTKIT